MRFDYSHPFILVNRVCDAIKETRLTAFLHLMFYQSRYSNVYMKTAMY